MDAVFSVDRSSVNGRAQVRFVGELDIADEERAQDEVIDVLDHTDGPLTIDLSSLAFCDASGVRVLLRLHAETMARGRAMVLQHPTPAVSRVFGVVGISETLTIEDGHGG
jgi:anti-sigma B factor antagonist